MLATVSSPGRDEVLTKTLTLAAWRAAAASRAPQATSEASRREHLPDISSSSTIARQHSPIMARGAMQAPFVALTTASARAGSSRGSA